MVQNDKVLLFRGTAAISAGRLPLWTSAEEVMRRYLLLAVVALLVGCGTARTLVLEPTRAADRFARVELIADSPTVSVPSDVTQKIESASRKGAV